jgi:integrase
MAIRTWRRLDVRFWQDHLFRETYRSKGQQLAVRLPSPLPFDGVEFEPRQSMKYRCESHFDRLNTWLRGKGVDTQRPLHTLRKEYGSLINKAHGIHATSKALRHADINMTNNFYTDSRARVTPGLGKLFASKKSTRLSPRLRMASVVEEENKRSPKATTSTG